MEIIRKTISIDNSRSHRNGLLPFVPYNSDDNNITEVTSGNVNGNYGQYVCDFVFCDEDHNETSRLRYLDVMRKYNYIQDQILHGIRLKRYTNSWMEYSGSCETIATCNNDCCKFSDSVSEFMSGTKLRCPKCGSLNVSCDGAVPHSEYKWIDTFDEEPLTYEYMPIDNRYFYEQRNGRYAFEITDDEDHTDICEILSANTFIMAIPNYDTVIKYDKDWDKWWNENGGDGWEKKYLDQDYDNNGTNFKFCYDVDKYLLGKVETISGITGSKVPNYVYYTNLDRYTEWISSVAPYSANTTEWVNRGGNEFSAFVSSIVPMWVSAESENENFEYRKPFIEIPIAFENEIGYDGYFTPYEYSYSADTLVPAYSAYTSSEDNVLTSPSSKFMSQTSAYVESMIERLYSPKAIHVTDGIYGIYEPFMDGENEIGQLYKCVFSSGWSETPSTDVYVSGWTKDADGNVVVKSKKFLNSINEVKPKSDAYQILDIRCAESTSDETDISIVQNDEGGEDCYISGKTYYFYTWWDCSKVTDPNGFKCADGELVDGTEDDKRYQNLTIAPCISYLHQNPKIGDCYYIMAKYDNGRVNRSYDEIDKSGEIKSLKVPFEVGVPFNIETLNSGEVIYDEVTLFDIKDGFATIDYVIGATSGANIEVSGIHYREKFPYVNGASTIVFIDNAMESELYYDYLNFEYNLERVYNDYYGLSRFTRRAEITGMEMDSPWTEKGAVITYLFTKDGTEGLMEEPIYKINLTYNRGNAAAWESYFKLSECNTLEDLQNYGNNYFNL